MPIVSADGTLLLDELHQGKNTLTVELDKTELEIDHDLYEIHDTIRVDFTVDRNLENFDVKGLVKFSIVGDCYRCLGKITEILEAHLNFLIQRRQASQEHLDSTKDDEFIEVVAPNTRIVDFGEYFREALVLELPIRIPSDNVGKMCPHCGDGSSLSHKFEQSGVDPRWNKLKKLKFAK